MPAPTRRPLRPARRAADRLRGVWDRPLTAYALLLGSSLHLLVLGLVMVYSASQIQALRYGHDAAFYFRKQLLAAVAGGVLLLLAARMPLRAHRMTAYAVLIVTVVLLCLVQVPGLGETVNGSTNWIALGGSFQLQPSEFAKLALVLWGADLLARKHDLGLLTEWKHVLVPLLPCALVLLGLVLIGGDMGTSVILCCALLGMLWTIGVPTRFFGLTLGAVAALCVLLIITSGHRMSRFACVGAVDPGPHDECWQAVHGLYALAAGGVFGSGLNTSTQKWGELPEPHTDFILAITGEELGLFGTLTVLALFALLLAAGLRTASRAEELFVRLAASGITLWIAVQAVINVGGALGMLPISGVPLPLFSYGGSALLSLMYAVGVLVALSRTDPSTAAALTDWRRSRTAGIKRVQTGVGTQAETGRRT